MPTLKEIPYTGKKKTIQSSWNEDTIKAKLEGYRPVPNGKLISIKAGDDVRYMSNNAFKSGGRIKANKFPEYLVCMNVFKNVSWCIQLKDPTLKVWVKTGEDRQKEKAKKDKILKAYEEGKLVQKKK